MRWSRHPAGWSRPAGARPASSARRHPALESVSSWSPVTSTIPARARGGGRPFSGRRRARPRAEFPSRKGLPASLRSLRGVGSLSRLPRAGAAGGIAASLHAVLDARLGRRLTSCSIASASTNTRGADLVLTAEGSLDGQRGVTRDLGCVHSGPLALRADGRTRRLGRPPCPRSCGTSLQVRFQFRGHRCPSRPPSPSRRSAHRRTGASVQALCRRPPRLTSLRGPLVGEARRAQYRRSP